MYSRGVRADIEQTLSGGDDHLELIRVPNG
jgi:hypothetical protein